MNHYIVSSLWAYLFLFLLSGTATATEGSSTPASKPLGKFIGGELSEVPSWFKDSFLEFEDDIDEAATNNKRLMLFIHQSGCPYCALLVNENFKKTDVADKIKNNLESVSVNMWGDRDIVAVGGKTFSEKTFAEALKVQYTPTLIFFNEQGKIALRINGYYPPDKFQMALDYVIKHKESELSFNQYVASRTAQANGGSLINEPFFLPPGTTLARTSSQNKRPLAVFFEQADCENCEILHNRILKDRATRELMNQMDAVQFNLWAKTELITPEGKKTTADAWAKKIDIGYTPSVVFFDDGGQEVARIDAFIKTFHFQSVLDYVLTKGYIKQPSFQRYISARAEHFREQGHDVDIWNYNSLHTQ